MLVKNVSITFLPIKNSFIYVSKNLTKIANGVRLLFLIKTPRKYCCFQSCVKLSFENGKTGYFSVTNSIATLSTDSIGISSLYCKALGIQENENALLSEIASLPAINSITITPLSESDFDIIVSNNV